MKKMLATAGLAALLLLMTAWTPAQHILLPPYPEPLPSIFTLLAQHAQNNANGAINPLTGLPVSDPNLLEYPPALLSITNWPISVRPQAGLSYAAMVYELYIGDGESRFLSIFYGNYPPDVQTAADDPSSTPKNTVLGPLRSGRLPYEPLQQAYSGFLVMASGWRGILDNLTDYNNFYSRESNSFTTAFVDVVELKEIARRPVHTVDPKGLAVYRFEDQAPSGGLPAPDFWFIYNAFDQVHWVYDAYQGAYLRYQDKADGETFVPASDRLNGETVTMENVVLLFADHRYCTPYAFEVDLLYMDRAPALFFRDGQVYKIYWTTKNAEYENTTGRLRPIRFVDANGNPFPMKPGQTWVHLAPKNTPYWEAPNSDNLQRMLTNQEPGSGIWMSRFFESLMLFDRGVCDRIGANVE